MTEFRRGVIEVLREPLETGRIHISRASGKAVFPARFQLVAAMNPCPGGCDSIKVCDCSAEQLHRYRNKLSAPLLDRIDIQIELGRLAHHELFSIGKEPTETSSLVRERVEAARRRQLQRQDCVNACLDNRDLMRVCAPDKKLEQLMLHAIDKLRLSARSYHKLLKLARTIADLALADRIGETHVAEAISYRQRGRRQA